MCVSAACASRTSCATVCPARVYPSVCLSESLCFVGLRMGGRDVILGEHLTQSSGEKKINSGNNK